MGIYIDMTEIELEDYISDDNTYYLTPKKYYLLLFLFVFLYFYNNNNNYLKIYFINYKSLIGQVK